MWRIRYQDGTLVVEGATLDLLPVGFRQDDRVGHPRGPAYLYRNVVQAARAFGGEYTDESQNYTDLGQIQICTTRTPRDYQREAVDAWHEAGRLGAVVLPTGSGKTFVAEMAIAETKRVLPHPVGPLSNTGNLRSAACSNASISFAMGR